MERLVKIEAEISWHALDILFIGVMDTDDWQKLQYIIENQVGIYLGSIAGKHSEVTLKIDPSEVEVITTAQDYLIYWRSMFPDGYVGYYLPEAINATFDDLKRNNEL